MLTEKWFSWQLNSKYFLKLNQKKKNFCVLFFFLFCFFIFFALLWISGDLLSSLAGVIRSDSRNFPAPTRLIAHTRNLYVVPVERRWVQSVVVLASVFSISIQARSLDQLSTWYDLTGAPPSFKGGDHDKVTLVSSRSLNRSGPFGSSGTAKYRKVSVKNWAKYRKCNST